MALSGHPGQGNHGTSGGECCHNAPVLSSQGLVLLNPTAGNGRAGRMAERLAALVSGDVEVVVPHSADHGSELALEAARSGLRVVAAGGDGTVQAVLNGLLAAGTPGEIGIVPIGSGNDLARSLGLPRALGRAVDVALRAPAAPIDVGLARAGDSSRWFGSAAGVGFDAQVATAMAGRRGRLQRGPIGYLTTTLVELRRSRNHRVRLRLEREDGTSGETELTILLAAVANGAYYGGGMRIAPDATVTDGWFDLITVADVSRLTALRQLPNLYRGTHLRHPAVAAARVRSVEIEALDGQPLALHLDGEPWRAAPVRLELHPGALAVARPTPRRSASLQP